MMACPRPAGRPAALLRFKFELVLTMVKNHTAAPQDVALQLFEELETLRSNLKTDLQALQFQLKAVQCEAADAAAAAAANAEATAAVAATAGAAAGGAGAAAGGGVSAEDFAALRSQSAAEMGALRAENAQLRGELEALRRSLAAQAAAGSASTSGGASTGGGLAFDLLRQELESVKAAQERRVAAGLEALQGQLDAVKKAVGGGKPVWDGAMVRETGHWPMIHVDLADDSR